MPTGEPPLTFGVWIELPPDSPLEGQGIVRLLAALLRALAPRPEARVVIAVPGWTAEPLRAVLAAEGVDLAALELVVSRRALPVYLRLRRAVTAPRAGRPRGERRWRRAARRLWNWPPLRAALRPVLATGSPAVAGAAALLGALLGLLLLPLLLPVALLAWLRRRGRLARRLRRRLAALRDRGARAVVPAWARRLVAMIDGEVLAFELDRLRQRANERHDVAAWLLPLPGATHATGLQAPLVVAVPDLVYVDFPSLYPEPAWQALDRRVRAVAQHAAALVSYSADVRDRHVVGHLGVPAARAHVIVNAPLHAAAAPDAVPAEAARAAAAARLADWFRTSPAAPGVVSPAHLADFPFAEVDFLFVSSQLRAHKNSLNLVRAFARLLRAQRRPLTLFFTGRWDDDHWGMRELVAREHLWLDVIAVPHLPADVLAAFYRLAALTVVPTLFEGGFPFPFGESLSVGTPVVMADIPATRAVVPAELAARMLFDPYDPLAMAERIGWALDHRHELLAGQRPLYEALSRRTWEAVAEDYLALLRQVAARPGPPQRAEPVCEERGAR